MKPLTNGTLVRENNEYILGGLVGQNNKITNLEIIHKEFWRSSGELFNSLDVTP